MDTHSDPLTAQARAMGRHPHNAHLTTHTIGRHPSRATPFPLPEDPAPPPHPGQNAEVRSAASLAHASKAET